MQFFMGMRKVPYALQLSHHALPRPTLYSYIQSSHFLHKAHITLDSILVKRPR